MSFPSLQIPSRGFFMDWKKQNIFKDTRKIEKDTIYQIKVPTLASIQEGTLGYIFH
jgi:hypothetical protein